jgi:hypothetical protein
VAESALDIAVPMTDAAAAWLDALSDEQRAKASFDFDDEAERTSWAYFPRNHAGLPLHEMDIKQQKLAHVLMSSALSLHAYAKVCAIMALESVLNRIEKRRGDAVRDPGRYFISVFGAPGAERWGWRLEGHHVALNFTFAGGGLVSPTPLFLGANPAEVRHGDHVATRPCGEEEDVARELLASLDADQRRIAVIATHAPPDFVLANAPVVPESAAVGELVPPFMRRVREINEAFEAMPAAAAEALRFKRAEPQGLAGDAMTEMQRHVLKRLIDVYVSRLPDELAVSELANIDPNRVCFAWAGSDRRGDGHYYRLQGERFLVEYDNTQDDANHVHAVWRDMHSDFGFDHLRRHLRDDH